jgi:hypothetical protein
MQRRTARRHPVHAVVQLPCRLPCLLQHIHYSQPPNAVALMQRIKDQLDPNGILNPYKLLPRR